jgi:hypothetical protein
VQANDYKVSYPAEAEFSCSFRSIVPVIIFLSLSLSLFDPFTYEEEFANQSVMSK